MFFTNCYSVEELKQEFRRLAFIHHPDKGGSVGMMQEINAEYTSRLSYLTNRASQSDVNYDAQEEVNIGERYREVIEKIIHLPNIEIEVCGSWIWVGGNTRPVSENLKAVGLHWAHRKNKWYWHPGEQKLRRHRLSKSMEWIRGTYGSVVIQPETAQQVPLRR